MDPGGQSAFGTKAGDLFTRITIVAAACWIFLLAFCVWWYTESDFTAALADDELLGTGPAIVAPADGGMSGPPSSDPSMSMPPPGTGEASSPVVPTETAPAGDRLSQPLKWMRPICRKLGIPPRKMPKNLLQKHLRGADQEQSSSQRTRSGKADRKTRC